jgi:AraC-like DNA-binding protein
MLIERIRHQLADAPDATGDRLRRVVRSLVAGGRFTVDDLASALGLSGRTLARRLRELGAGFRELLDDARFVTARNLLQSSKVPVAEIAARLGYSDTAAFTRAFRRWAGTPPAEWRHRHRTI